MAKAIYTQTTIAVVWDFDRTLIPNYSQAPLFKAYNANEASFWAEVNALPGLYRDRGITVADDTAYLLHMLTYVREGIFAGLTNSRLRELGAELEMCPGIPDFLGTIQSVVKTDERFAKHNIDVEHYVVSTGIKPLIEGSPVGSLVTRIWANEFVDSPPPPNYLAQEHALGEEGPIAQVSFMLDNTSKTRALFEINKGPNYPVNARIAQEDRRVPFPNMIYVADGPSDVPGFSVVRQYGGRCLGVYQTGEKTNYLGVKQLEDDARVDSIAPADFRPEQPAYLWLTATVGEIASRICDERDRYFASARAPAGHVP